MNAKTIVILVLVGLMGFFSQPVYATLKSSQDAVKKEEPSESLQSAASEETRALKNFERIVDDFSKFFATNPKYLSKEADESRTKTAYIFYRIGQQVLKRISFDVRKTDSLVSPFIGYIYVEFIGKENTKCGDVFYRDTLKQSISAKPLGYSNIHKALGRANEDSCFETHSSTITYRYEFAYQSGRWVLKTIKSLYEGVFSQEDVITAVLGIKEGVCRFITEPAGLDFNKKWFVLVKPYLD